MIVDLQAASKVFSRATEWVAWIFGLAICEDTAETYWWNMLRPNFGFSLTNIRVIFLSPRTVYCRVSEGRDVQQRQRPLQDQVRGRRVLRDPLRPESLLQRRPVRIQWERVRSEWVQQGEGSRQKDNRSQESQDRAVNRARPVTPGSRPIKDVFSSYYIPEITNFPKKKQNNWSDQIWLLYFLHGGTAMYNQLFFLRPD